MLIRLARPISVPTYEHRSKLLILRLTSFNGVLKVLEFQHNKPFDI